MIKIPVRESQSKHSSPEYYKPWKKTGVRLTVLHSEEAPPTAWKSIQCLTQPARQHPNNLFFMSLVSAFPFLQFTVSVMIPDLSPSIAKMWQMHLIQQ